MSEPYQPPEKDAGDAKSQEKKKGSGLLRIILFAILLVMVGLLGLDLYARNASKTAFEKVVKQVEQKTKAPPEEIHKLLGREPDQPIETKEHYFQETYSWQRGNLLKKEYIKVLYANEDDEPKLHEVVRNVEPEMNDIPNPEPAELDPADVDPVRDGIVDPGAADAEEPTADGDADDGAEPGDADEPSDESEPTDGEPDDSEEATDEGA